MKSFEVTLLLPLIGLIQKLTEMGDEMNINNMISPNLASYVSDMFITINLDNVFVRLLNENPLIMHNTFLYLNKAEVKYNTRNFKNDNQTDQNKVTILYESFKPKSNSTLLNKNIHISSLNSKNNNQGDNLGLMTDFELNSLLNTYHKNPF